MKILRELLTILLIVVCLSRPAKTQSGELKNSIGILFSGGYYNSFHLKDTYDSYFGKGKIFCLGLNYSRFINEKFQVVFGIKVFKFIERPLFVCIYCSSTNDPKYIDLFSLPVTAKYTIAHGFSLSAGFDYHFDARSIHYIIDSGNKLRSLNNYVRLGFNISISKDIRLADRLYVSIEPQLILLSFSDYLFNNLYPEENYAGLNLIFHRKFDFKNKFKENNL